MRKNLLVRGLIGVVVVLALTATVSASGARCYVSTRGDWQVLENSPGHSVVRVWVDSWCQNNCMSKTSKNGCGGYVQDVQALVTVVVYGTNGQRVLGHDTVSVPPWAGPRPVDVVVESDIEKVDRVFATRLNTN